MSDTSAGPRLLGPAEVRQLAAELDLRPTKQRGQNFVIDPNTVRRIVRESGVGAGDVVVEVGPGLGSLTLALLEVVDRVVAVELDELLASRLPRTLAEHAPAVADRCERGLIEEQDRATARVTLRLDPGDPTPQGGSHGDEKQVGR